MTDTKDDGVKPPRPKLKSVAPPKPRKNVATLEKAKSSVAESAEYAKKAVTRAKRVQAAAQQKLKALEAIDPIVKGEQNLLDEAVLKQVPETVQKYVETKEAIFKPNPGPQTQFLAATEKEVFYGGARGGGKSYSMLVDPLRYCYNRNHRAIIIRKTMPELRDMISKSQFLYPKAYPGARWREQEKEWRFPSGARIEFGYCENTSDVTRYLGQSYSWIGVDELPLFPDPDIWNFLRSSLRSPDPTLPTFMRATGNPGCVGSRWVKEMFIDPAPPNTRFDVQINAETPAGVINSKITRRFIPSTVFDNPYLTYDQSYVTMLASLPDVQRRQFLDGDWSAFDGAAFSEFRESLHVVPMREVPPNWPKFRAADWGYSSPACCLWFAIDPDGVLEVYRELYVTKMTADLFAQEVLRRESGDRIRYGVLDVSTWSMRGDRGPSIAEQMIKEGCKWIPSDRSKRSRENGKIEVHRRLAIDPILGKPRLRIQSNCVNLIRTLPQLPVDENNVEDVDTDFEDHAYDALRYGVMSRSEITLRGHAGVVRKWRPFDPVFGG
jgi:hypothetical protein